MPLRSCGSLPTNAILANAWRAVSSRNSVQLLKLHGSCARYGNKQKGPDEGEQIVFCGYSLPDADMHVKDMLKTGRSEQS